MDLRHSRQPPTTPVASTLALLDDETGLALPADELARAVGYARDRHSPATRKAYRTDFQIFAMWCAERGLPGRPADPAAIAIFLATQADAGIATSTLVRRLAAIRYAHLTKGIPSPTSAEAVRSTLAGIRRRRAVAGQVGTPKRPIVVPVIERLVAACPGDLAGVRDRALLLLGFAGAFRRSELAAIEADHLSFEAAGLRVRIPRSKSDQDGQGQEVAILAGQRPDFCPVRALKTWLELGKIDEGPVFRRIDRWGRRGHYGINDRTVHAIVTKKLAAAGLDPAEFTAHGLRAGFLTSAAEAGAGLFAMMDVSRHKSVETVRQYVKRADAFKNHAAQGLL